MNFFNDSFFVFTTFNKSGPLPPDRKKQGASENKLRAAEFFFRRLGIFSAL